MNSLVSTTMAIIINILKPIDIFPKTFYWPQVKWNMIISNKSSMCELLQVVKRLETLDLWK